VVSPPALAGAARSALHGVLTEARSRGLLGPGEIDPHIDHALGFARALGVPADSALDLGSGAGLPGLVLALAWPESRWLLLDSSARRVRFLESAIGRLELEGRVEARQDRAEVAGRDPLHRGQYSLVVSRSFGPPATVAEAAAPFLVVGGTLVVSEPPTEADERWPSAGLARVALAPVASAAVGYVVFRQQEPCPDRYPRRPAAQARDPLF
jgi:16S rRNA (guanine527-N7)-methyltransferase